MKSRASSASKSKFKIPIGFLVAGVVALAAAVMIKSGAGYAVQTRTTSKNDSVSLVINTQCAFASSNVNGATAEDGTYEATGMNGGEASWTNNKNVRAFNIACNQLRGYDVFAYATDLDRQDDDDPSKVIGFVADVDEYEQRMSSTPGRGIWTAVVTGGNDGALLGYGEGNETKIKTNNGVSLPTGDEFTVTYRAYIGRTTESGTYSGEAVYTLTPHPLIFDYQWTVNYALGGGSWNRGLEDNNKDTGRTDLGNDTTVKIGMYEGSQEAGATAVSPTKAGHTFLGWGTEDAPTTATYQSGDEITLGENEVGVAETLYAVWDEDRYTWKVNFHYNDGSSNKTTQTNTESVLSNATVTLTPPTDLRADGYRDGYSFLGWSTNASATVADAGFGAADSYGANKSLTIPAGAKNATVERNYYAVWKQNMKTFQSFTWNDCKAIPKHTKGASAADTANSIITVKDERDDKQYLVAHMADDRCWMVQNLAIAPGTTIYKATSNITADSYPIPNTTSLSGAFSDNDTAYAYKRTEHVNASPNLKASNTGVYYSWQAATAGTGSSVSQGSNASVDICPKGWRLPTGTSSGEFATLYNAYGSHANFKDSPWGSGTADTLWGYYTNGSLGNEGSRSYWWSSTRYSNADYAYYLYMDTSGVYPSNASYRRYGFTVRCVYDDRTMQNFNATTMNIGDEKILTDARDGKQYVVRKYEDGAVWMAQDLDMDIYISDCTGSHSSGATSGAVGTCRETSGGAKEFVAFTSGNTNITENWTIASGSKGYDVQRTTGVTWDTYGRNGGTTSTYEVRSYDGNNNKCMKSYSSKSSDNTGDGETGSSSVVDCGSGGTTSNAIGEANTQRIGNYYNWTTATAGTVIEGNGTATKSICPKGWQLPAGGTTEALNGVKGSFGYLFKQEGVVSTVTTSTSMSDDIMKKTTGNTNTTKGHQLTFLRSGIYDYNSAVVKFRGYCGYYWSSESYRYSSNYYGRLLYFYVSGLYPGTNGNSKGFGYAVRCVAL